MNCFLVNNPKCCWDDVVTWGFERQEFRISSMQSSVGKQPCISIISGFREMSDSMLAKLNMMIA